VGPISIKCLLSIFGCSAIILDSVIIAILKPISVLIEVQKEQIRIMQDQSHKLRSQNELTYEIAAFVSVALKDVSNQENAPA